jgi:hypothetical protein
MTVSNATSQSVSGTYKENIYNSNSRHSPVKPMNKNDSAQLEEICFNLLIKASVVINHEEKQFYSVAKDLKPFEKRNIINGKFVFQNEIYRCNAHDFFKSQKLSIENLADEFLNCKSKIHFEMKNFPVEKDSLTPLKRDLQNCIIKCTELEKSVSEKYKNEISIDEEANKMQSDNILFYSKAYQAIISLITQIREVSKFVVDEVLTLMDQDSSNSQ